MKPAKEKPWWLRSAWYRPPSLAALGKLYDSDIRRQESDYIGWLAEVRKWERERAAEYARAQACEAVTGELGGSKLREEERIGDSIIRTMRPAPAREHWCPGYDDVEGAWEKADKSEFVTTYTVMHLGRYHDAFLSKAKARACALALVEKERALQQQVREAIALCEAA